MTTLPTGQVRYTRSQTAFGTRPVELVTSDPRGDLVEGRMRVSERLAHSKPHTNERLELTDYIASQVKRWVDWRERLGWRLCSTPQVKGPFPVPIDNPDAEVPDWVEYRTWAHFKPIHPILASFEDVYEMEQRAAVYGIDLWAPKPVSSLAGQKTKKTIWADRPPEDPMVIAEARRQQYGMKREDLLMGPLSEPLKEPK